MLPLLLALLHQLHKRGSLTIKQGYYYASLEGLKLRQKKAFNSFGKWPIKTTAKVLNSFSSSVSVA
jgi:hypothetical protein